MSDEPSSPERRPQNTCTLLSFVLPMAVFMLIFLVALFFTVAALFTMDPSFDTIFRAAPYWALSGAALASILASLAAFLRQEPMALATLIPGVPATLFMLYMLFLLYTNS